MKRPRKSSRGGARPGAGRPPRGSEALSAALGSVRVAPAVRERLDAIATERGCSVADLVREAVSSYLSSGGDTWQGRVHHSLLELAKSDALTDDERRAVSAAAHAVGDAYWRDLESR